MTARFGLGAFSLFCLISFGGCFAGAGNAGDEASYIARRRLEVDALLARPSSSTLATAALLSYPTVDAATQPLDLIQRAATMAPERADLVWAQRAICRRFECAEAESIENHLKELDPDNGAVWISALARAEQAGSDNDVTEVIKSIGATKKMTFYWNSLQVTLFDALAVANPKESVATRAIEADGLLSSQILPPLQTLTKPCRPDQFDIPGRRAACEALATRMEHADTLILQSLALSMQARWWPEGSPERESVVTKRRQLDYEIQMSSRLYLRINRYMSIRVEASRHSEREEDVLLAVMKAYGIPMAAPPDWRDTRQAV